MRFRGIGNEKRCCHDRYVLSLGEHWLTTLQVNEGKRRIERYIIRKESKKKGHRERERERERESYIPVW